MKRCSLALEETSQEEHTIFRGNTPPRDKSVDPERRGEDREDRAVKYVSKRRTGGRERRDGKDMQSQMQTGSGMKRQETQEVVVGEKEEERD